MQPALSGIFVPTVAPYDAGGHLNEPELRKMISWLIGKGVSGLYPNGSLGEFIRLSFEERKEVVRIICDEADGRVPVLAGAAEPNLEMALEMCHHCAELGCRAVSLTGPYYYKLSQESIETWFRQIAAQSPIDIVIYNIPMFANEISVEVLRRLAIDCPRIIGTKDSSKDLCRFQQAIHAIAPERPEFAHLIGWEELMVPALLLGAHGGTLSTCGVAPEIIMKIYETARAGRWEEARDMEYRILDLFRAMVQTPNFPEGFRAGYEIRGFDIGRARFPNSEDENRELDAMRHKIACLLADFGFAEAAAICRQPAPTQTTPAHAASNINIQQIVREVTARLKH